MKISSLVEYNFKDDRLKRESAREFICQFLDSSQVDMVMECAYELNMTVEQSTAYALAMFNAIQDLWYFHYNMKLGRITVTTTTESTPITDRDRIIRFRQYMMEPYFSYRPIKINQILAYLKRQSKNMNRLSDDGRIKFENEKKYIKKKEKERKKKRAASVKKYLAKKKKAKKKWYKNSEWSFMP